MANLGSALTFIGEGLANGMEYLFYEYTNMYIPCEKALAEIIHTLHTNRYYYCKKAKLAMIKTSDERLSWEKIGRRMSQIILTSITNGPAIIMN